MKILNLPNYNTEDDIFVYVEPDVEVTETQDVVYEWVSKNKKYAPYWSNNWRRNHGYPAQRNRKKNFKFYVKPQLMSVEDTLKMREATAFFKDAFE